MNEAVLKIENLSAGYYGSLVLNKINMVCNKGITLLIGPNSAGKTTLVRSITGLLRPVNGRIMYMDNDIHTLTAVSIARLGLSLVPERARLFDQMTVRDNLLIGYGLAKKRGLDESFDEALAEVLKIFPELSGKLGNKASKLSGGEQQLVAIARAFISHPNLLIMDEPTTGLYPLLLRRLVVKIEEISRGLPILITEQNVEQVARVANYVYLLESGTIALEGYPDEMLENEKVKSLYLGGRR